MRDIGLPSPVSDAIPPITRDEAVGCKTAICRTHGGQRTGPAYGDKYGDVLFCAVGRTYFRLVQNSSGMHAPLTWPKNL